ncbi:MAG: hypothetical protein E7523_05080 [Ruminococcaceae bacterium]|nr:hypothetical protein [Oscillospiraceae bacterium]
MKFITPSYYDEFQCVADKCTDNCCIGWEIGIDSDTAAYYRSLGGAFGKRLCENIADDDTFILQDERCPFLNNKNLCDIIIHCGKEHLCQICRDHPRYFEWYGNVKEGGIGLSCEEGARLILTTDRVLLNESQTDENEEEIDEELFRFLCVSRKQIFDLLAREDMPPADKLCEILSFAEKLQFIMDNPQAQESDFVQTAKSFAGDPVCAVAELFSDFEPIDAAWTTSLREMQAGLPISFSALSGREENYIINLCRYFLWRYFLKGVFDGEILSKVKFAVVSPLVIRLLCGKEGGCASWIEKSKLYSKQMEYSDENRELFYDYTYEKAYLATPQLQLLVKTVATR